MLDSAALLNGVISNLLFNGVIFVVGFFYRDVGLYRFDLRDVKILSRTIRRLKYLFLLNFIFIIAVFVADWFSLNGKIVSAITSFALLSAYATYVLASCKNLFLRMKKAGVVEIDDSVESGTDYEKALSLTDQSIRFLGIGAHKLTQVNTFTKTIERCDGNGRGEKTFLICDPRSTALVQMEKRNKKLPGEYKRKILESLETIKKIQARHIDISVYLYNASEIEQLPVFRLFFSNSDTVLVSFYVISENNDDGKKLPQMKFTRTGPSSSFYFAFESYYKNFISTAVKYTDIEKLLDELT